MSTKLMIKLKVWSNSSSSKLGRRFGWPMPYFSVALVFLPFFPSVPRFTSKQPQPLDSGIAPAGDCHLSQEEGFLWEVIEYSRRLLQGLLIRPSGLPSRLFAHGPARPLPRSSPALLSVLFRDPGFIYCLALLSRHCILAPDCMMDLPIGLPCPWASRVNLSHSCSEYKELCSPIFLCGASAPDIPGSIFWVFYLKEGWWHIWYQWCPYKLILMLP